MLVELSSPLDSIIIRMCFEKSYNTYTLKQDLPLFSVEVLSTALHNLYVRGVITLRRNEEKIDISVPKEAYEIVNLIESGNVSVNPNVGDLSINKLVVDAIEKQIKQMNSTHYLVCFRLRMRLSKDE